jgi:hypothetical protein
MEAYLVADKLGWFPVALTENEISGIPVKYWILIVATIVLCLGRVARAAIPLLGISWFILTEAFGLMPSSFAMLKYLLVLLTIGIYAFLESGFRLRRKRKALA